MAKTAKPKAVNDDSDKKTKSSTSKKSSSSGTKAKSPYRAFFSKKMEELKESGAWEDGNERRAEANRLWKIDPSNPKNQESE